MSTKNADILTNSLRKQESTVYEIEKKLDDAMDACKEMYRLLGEASDLAGTLAIPGGSILENIIYRATDEDDIDEAQGAAGELAGLFSRGKMDKLYPKCKNCKKSDPRGGCSCKSDVGDIDFPCKDFEPMPPGCHCLRCQWYKLMGCQELKHPERCSENYCCGKYAPGWNVTPPDDDTPPLPL